MADKTDKEDEGRLSRWSRLKQAERDGVASTPETTSVVGAVETAAVSAEGVTEPEAEIAAEDLPDIETLGKESDFTPFMQKGVPEHLKRMALRKLWSSDPVLANIDGLNDYDDDFSIVETINAALQSSYQVGKGIVSDEEREAEESAAKAEAGAETGAETEGVSAEKPAEAAPEDADEKTAAAEPVDNPADETADIAVALEKTPHETR